MTSFSRLAPSAAHLAHRAPRSIPLALGVIALVAASSGCGEPEVLRLASLDDGDYLGGEQVTQFQLQSGLVATRAELRVDDRRVAYADAPPFELRWDTRAHSEKRHRISVRVRVAGGDEHEASAEVIIDNTPPELGELPAELRDGQRVSFEVSDNFEVSHLEVSWGDEPTKLTRPFQLTWPGGCGEVPLTVRAFDRAGGEAVRVYPITSADQRDLDCDGHRAIPFGDDCDDLRPWVHGGALESPEGLDYNCDGVIAQRPGTDADRDGVLSIGDGGDDCDDSNPFFHGARVVLTQSLLQTADGGQLQWSRGQAMLEDFSYPWLLFLNRVGVVEQWVWESGNVVRGTAIANGATPGVFTVKSGFLAYGRGSEVVILRRVSGSWSFYSSFFADTAVTHVGLDVGGPGQPVIAYQAGTRVWLARRASNGDAWTQQRLASPGALLVEAPQVRDLFAGNALVTFRTAGAAWSAHRTAPSNIELRTLTAADARPIAMATELNRGFAVVAVHEATGSAIYVHDLFSTAPPRRHAFEQRVAGLHIADAYLYIQLESGEVWAAHYRDGLRRAQVLPGLLPIDHAAGGAFAASGSIYFRNGNTVLPAADAPGDRQDTNCDGDD
jgi:Putative metal-binding motif